jgi:hypothetical protein
LLGTLTNLGEQRRGIDHDLSRISRFNSSHGSNKPYGAGPQAIRVVG